MYVPSYLKWDKCENTRNHLDAIQLIIIAIDN